MVEQSRGEEGKTKGGKEEPEAWRASSTSSVTTCSPCPTGMVSSPHFTAPLSPSPITRTSSPRLPRQWPPSPARAERPQSTPLTSAP
eukprot:2599283-Rhodomonas_salina.1